MAKKGTSTALAIKHALARGRAQGAARPIILRAPAPVHHKKKHHGGGHGGGIAGIFSSRRTHLMMGAYAVGVIEKQGLMQQLPALPILGHTGTIGVAAHMISGGKAGLADDIATAAFIIAAHELGQTGSIVGGDGGTGYDHPGIGYVAGY
jgi:hypothetical protein